jgi:two-component system, OmpR family, response regulator
MTKILVIDDDNHIRKLYGDFLTREGYDVKTVANAAEAYEIIRQEKFDLVVLDIELGGDSGLDMLKQFKIEYPDTPVILNTAYSVYKSDFNTWVADGYIMKSSDIQSLKNKIEELLCDDATTLK